MDKYKICTTKELIVNYNKLNVEKNLLYAEEDKEDVINEMSMIEGELRCRLDDMINILISIERELKPYEVERLLRMLIKRY